MTPADIIPAATKTAYRTIIAQRALGIYENTAVYGAAYDAIVAGLGPEADKFTYPEKAAAASEAIITARDIYAENFGG